VEEEKMTKSEVQKNALVEKINKVKIGIFQKQKNLIDKVIRNNKFTKNKEIVLQLPYRAEADEKSFEFDILKEKKVSQFQSLQKNASPSLKSKKMSISERKILEISSKEKSSLMSPPEDKLNVIIKSQKNLMISENAKQNASLKVKNKLTSNFFEEEEKTTEESSDYCDGQEEKREKKKQRFSIDSFDEESQSDGSICSSSNEYLRTIDGLLTQSEDDEESVTMANEIFIPIKKKIPFEEKNEKVNEKNVKKKTTKIDKENEKTKIEDEENKKQEKENLVEINQETKINVDLLLDNSVMEQKFDGEVSKIVREEFSYFFLSFALGCHSLPFGSYYEKTKGYLAVKVENSKKEKIPASRKEGAVI
jgi:hypothetical protein